MQNYPACQMPWAKCLGHVTNPVLTSISEHAKIDYGMESPRTTTRERSASPPGPARVEPIPEAAGHPRQQEPAPQLTTPPRNREPVNKTDSFKERQNEGIYCQILYLVDFKDHIYPF